MQSDDVRYAAIASRDRRFEGRFFVAVRTTGIYCRPGCPAPLPKRKNVCFYACAAAAEEAGFRPCMRCRPETAPGTPAWAGTSATVSRAVRLIAEGALDHDGDIDGLATRLGVGARHLRRLFAEHLGASPIAVATTRRVHFARKLIDETTLPMAEVAAGAGFASVRRFNDAIRQTFRKPPRILREETRKKAGDPAEGAPITLALAVHEPYDFASVLAFLAPRAIPGIEVVTKERYCRTVPGGWIAVERTSERALSLSAHGPVSAELIGIAGRGARLFDIAADPARIAAHLGQDPRLARSLAVRPGLRVPGAWDGFELAVRAVLGQQVTVKGATTLAGRLVAELGRALPKAGPPGLTHVFPTPTALANADLSRIGLPAARAATLRALGAAVASGAVSFDGAQGLEHAVAALTAIPGVGPWTAHYIAMRAMGEPDAFPASDLHLRRAFGQETTRALEARAEAWRPWRAYAAMHLWVSGSTEEEKP